MSKLTIEGIGSVEVAAGTRLISALMAHGGDPLHRCGGNARCTTCRVEFLDGLPSQITVAEKAKLAEKGLSGAVRLSCQIACDHDMHVKVLNPFAASGLGDAGPAVADTITPTPEWTTI